MAKKRLLSLERKKSIFGVLFISPWIIGFLLLMAVPLYQSIRFSFSELTINATGYSLEYVGWANFNKAFFVDTWFNRSLTEAVTKMLLNVPLIIFFSLFTATLLSQKFRGRMLTRSIIFLPVVMASGVIAGLDGSNYLASMMGEAANDMEGNYTGLSGFDLIPFLLDAGMSRSVVFYFAGAVDRIYQIVTSSGVQILIFLAGIQSISPSLYEASKMEGATGYESFWKITFPMMTPLILTNTVYSIVDSFYKNNVTNYIKDIAFRQLNFGLSSAMSWAYFVLISIILLISTTIISKRVFYYD
ncbi:carbohydrate ABC transporter permease [Paenibacillus spongiae]|uniref:Sugar ABC transporter permease n=1 Tax=Paenibacillus spongiae TaxID=2909671 RepID=A0ABY5SGI0_9BACL|nr:sugar ABC transporter permease [Paenibacillus spongiae]UVI31827.1 sugar ABC transporter permease [Paenibacillus spongiae]